MGDERWYYALSLVDLPPVYMDRETFGVGMYQRATSVANLEEYHRPRPKHWRVAMVGTLPEHRRQGHCARLLDVVAQWAAEDSCECYLECAGTSAPAFRACGFREVWEAQHCVDDADQSKPLHVFGMARPPRAASPPIFAKPGRH